MTGRGCRYAYEYVTWAHIYDEMGFNEEAPRPGERMPRFRLPTTDGESLSSADLAGAPYLLVTGSVTCPMTASAIPVLERLRRSFGDRVRFVMLYVREAHPGEVRDQARSRAQKTAQARALRERESLSFPVLVDDVEGSLHRALDEKPNAAFLVDENGVLVFRSLWAADEIGLARALEAVARGEPVPEPESTRRMMPYAYGLGRMQEMITQAGPRAQRNVLMVVPPVAIAAYVADFFRPLPPPWRTLAALATMGAGVALGAAMVRRAGRGGA